MGGPVLKGRGSNVESSGMRYFVSQGDCLSSIASEFGLADWQAIYSHAQNEAFRNLRPDPNVIYPGDELFIPDVTQRTEQGATDRLHSFQRKLEPTLLRLVLLDEDHHPLADTLYRLEVGGTVFQGQSGGDGLVEQVVPPRTTRARLSIELTHDPQQTGYTWDLRLGAIDPPTVMTGLQARLNNLGYNTGPVDGVQGPRTTEAIRDFQNRYGLKVDGVVGPITRGKLVEVHGC